MQPGEEEVSEKSSALAQRSQAKIHFDHADMDYYLAWILGREVFGACDREESMATAARITDGDPASWRKQWFELAARVEAEAEQASAQGLLEAARGAYLRACTYYRAPLFIMPADHPQFDHTVEQMRACFQSALLSDSSPIETLAVAYAGAPMFGYFARADYSGQAAPTLVVAGGIETFVEDCYLLIGPTALARGYNVLTVDLPGQGLTPHQGLHFGARMERPLAAVLDYALARPEVDAERLALYGVSWGGHIAFKAGAHDRRLQAMIANPPMPNVFRAVLGQQQGQDRGDPVTKQVFEQIVWRMGLKISFNPLDIARRFGKAYDYLVHGRAKPEHVECATLCLAGEGEAEITLKIARECEAKLPHPQSRLLIFTAADGSEAHCQVDNPEVANQAILDWLDGVFSSPDYVKGDPAGGSAGD